MAQRPLHGAEVAGPVGRNLEHLPGGGCLHGEGHVVFSDGFSGNRLIDSNIIALTESKGFIMQFDLQFLAVNPERGIMDNAVLVAVEGIHEGMERRIVANGDLAGVRIGPLGDHRTVGKRLHPGDIGKVDPVHKGTVGLEHLHEAGCTENRRLVERDDQRGVHAQDRSGRIRRQRLSSLRFRLDGRTVGR